MTAIAGMFAGLFGGVFLEPLKHRIQLAVKSRRVEADIHRELGFIFLTFRLQAQEQEDGAERVKIYFDLLNDTDLDYYFSRERDAFNRLKDQRDIRAFYALFQRIRQTVIEEKIDPIEGAQMVVNDLNRRFKVGGLEQKVIQKYADEYVKLLDSQGKKMFGAKAYKQFSR
ncbi:MAG TPA: hypothetical protein VFR24_21975 [Candidatus Angelobacter sp.]|nr:hypothetical protein [Candidatus Angelobacter sp.]